MNLPEVRRNVLLRTHAFPRRIPVNSKADIFLDEWKEQKPRNFFQKFLYGEA